MFKFTCIQNLHCINDYKLTIKQQQQNGDVRELVYFRIYCSSTEKLKYFNTAWWYFLHYCIYIEREFIHLKISKGVCVCENKLVHFKISWGKFIKIITFISKSWGGVDENKHVHFKISEGEGGFYNLWGKWKYFHLDVK